MLQEFVPQVRAILRRNNDWWQYDGYNMMHESVTYAQMTEQVVRRRGVMNGDIQAAVFARDLSSNTRHELQNQRSIEIIGGMEFWQVNYGRLAGGLDASSGFSPGLWDRMGAQQMLWPNRK